MSAHSSVLKRCPNCNTHWNTPHGYASHTRACRPLVVTSNLQIPDELMWFEAEVLAGSAHRLVAALIKPEAGRED